VVLGAAAARGIDDPGQLERGSEQAPQVRVALGADAVGGRVSYQLRDGTCSIRVYSRKLATD
jgi:hypothetical protein